MKNKRIISSIVVIGALLVIFSIYTSADSAATPGSVDDPMVSKSYVDQQVKQQVAAEVAAQLAKLPIGGSSSAALTIVKLEKGQTLMAGAGSEFIVRTGYVTAVSNDNNGIPDITAGKDIAAKTAISWNHLLIFPTDKRGVQADPKKTTDIFIMVRGGFTALNADGSAAAPTIISTTPAAPVTPAATATPEPSPAPAASAAPPVVTP